MTRRLRTAKPQDAKIIARQTIGAPRTNWLVNLPALLTSALVVCRLLTPTEGAVVGETIWIAQLSLLALLVWALVQYRQALITFRLDGIDLAVIGLAGSEIVAAWMVDSKSGDQRAALNMLWEWCGIAATYFLLRYTVAIESFRRLLVLVLVATAVTLAGLGVWQHHFGLAATVHEVDQVLQKWDELQHQGRPADPEAAFRWDNSVQRLRGELAQMNVPADEASRVMWEQRLRSSVEPFGLFALANTFAGLLLVALVLLVAAVSVAGWQRAPQRVVVGGAIACVAVGYCLILTKSRTGYVGLLAGLVAWGLSVWRTRSTMSFRGVLAGGGATLAVLIGLVCVAAWTGGVDRLILSESTKSLRYRLEYWTGTWQLLVDEPRNWLAGVGPGNFRQNYLKHKLPESSEEILDPHNLLLDVWANAGIVAVVGLVGLCVATVRPLVRLSSSQGPAGNPEPHPAIPRVAFFLSDWHHPATLGGALGFLLVFLVGGGFETQLVVLFPGWLLALALAYPLLGVTCLPGRVVAAAGVGLSVHLLGAGGIAMPAITQTLLMLIAVGAAQLPVAAWRRDFHGRLPAVAFGLVAAGLYAGCWFTATVPDFSRKYHMHAGDAALFEAGRPSQAEREYDLAAKADPYSAEPYDRLSQLAYQKWLGADAADDVEFDVAVGFQQRAIDRNPRYSGGYRMLGNWYLVRFDRTGLAADATHAVDLLNQAYDLNPQQSAIVSELAEALWKGGWTEAARTFAERAVELDAINRQAGHLDKFLSSTRLDRLQQVLTTTYDPSRKEDAN